VWEPLDEKGLKREREREREREVWKQESLTDADCRST
jgi:hypothetical protein